MKSFNGVIDSGLSEEALLVKMGIFHHLEELEHPITYDKDEDGFLVIIELDNNRRWTKEDFFDISEDKTDWVEKSGGYDGEAYIALHAKLYGNDGVK